MPSRVDDLGLNSSLQAVSDPTLQPLYDSTFDPVDFLNSNLTTASFSSGPQNNLKSGRLPQIQAASSEIQTFLSKLNAHNSRCSTSLTQLTDEILRSGSRLAYEVEILRGDVNSLDEVLTDTLLEDIRKFSSQGSFQDFTDTDHETIMPANGDSGVGSQDPEFITRLRMLGEVKARLETVIKVFGEAMQWPLPPSELSMTSSLISVSAPELGMLETTDDEIGREASNKLRTEIAELLDSDGGARAGLDAATKRVEDLRKLTVVWRGTAEEKARIRFVDSLAKLAEDRRKVLDARSVQQRPRGDSLNQRSSSMPVRSAQSRADSSNPATGFMRNLQKLRDEIYLD